METSSSSRPAFDLSTPLYFQVVYTLTNLLPPPLDDTPEALHARNLAAIAKVAALLPVNANETDLAAQCIAARAQAEDVLRLLRQHAADIGLVMRLNAQYGSMVRTSLSVHGRLMRVQALRQKRHATGAAANEDAWAQHVAEQSMLGVVGSDVGPLDTASPKRAPDEPSPSEGLDEASPDLASVSMRVEAPQAPVDQSGNVSETETNSPHMAFETWLSEQPWNASGPGETDLRQVLRQAMANSRLAARGSPSSGRQNPGSTD